MPVVRVKDNEIPEIALRRFKRTCEKAGVLSELRRREFYEKPTWERKRKRAAAKKRLQKKLSKEMLPTAKRKRTFAAMPTETTKNVRGHRGASSRGTGSRTR